MEAQINHRLGEDRADAFVSQLLSVRTLARDGATQQDLENAVAATVTMLQTDITDLADAPELNDQWTRVAQRIVAQVDQATEAYAAGNFDDAATAARQAYLGHYEADGLEKATISYLGQGRVNELESMFTTLRQEGRDGQVSLDEFTSVADTLSQAITEDAATLDELTSQSELGWSGFWASFLILLREGAEALLVVAALVTYAMKAGRRDQLVGILTGVVAALALSVGLAVLFTRLTSSAATGFGQELLEGITGLLAVVMLIWVSNWILSKSTGKKFQQYIDKTASHGVSHGGTFALASVAFLAVLREGAETILFFSPILSGAKTGGDYLKIWLGVGLAVAILAVLFALVWFFGIKLPLGSFFKWTSILLGILAITIAGGAIKEFQDATVVPSTQLPGIPQISWLGLYPTVETIAAQLVVAAIFIVLGVIQYRASRTHESHTPQK